MRTLRYIVLVVMVGCGTAWAQQFPWSGGQSKPDADFVRLDTNKDNYIDRKEAGRDKEVRRNLPRFDVNKDGKLTQQEYVALKSTLARENAKEYVADSVITAKVKTALATGLGAKSTAIAVTTEDGIVTLSGTVDKSTMAKRAAAIAIRVGGVKKVDNKLKPG